MKLRRGPEDVLLTADLTRRLAAYKRESGVHCHGCGAWVAEDDEHVPHWGYDRRGGGTTLHRYCDRCARLGIMAR